MEQDRTHSSTSSGPTRLLSYGGHPRQPSGTRQREPHGPKPDTARSSKGSSKTNLVAGKNRPSFPCLAFAVAHRACLSRLTSPWVLRPILPHDHLGIRGSSPPTISAISRAYHLGKIKISTPTSARRPCSAIASQRCHAVTLPHCPAWRSCKQAPSSADHGRHAGPTSPSDPDMQGLPPGKPRPSPLPPPPRLPLPPAPLCVFGFPVGVKKGLGMIQVTVRRY